MSQVVLISSIFSMEANGSAVVIRHKILSRFRDGNRSGRPAGRVAGLVEILRSAGQAG